jgi:hypothetical protein
VDTIESKNYADDYAVGAMADCLVSLCGPVAECIACGEIPETPRGWHDDIA